MWDEQKRKRFEDLRTPGRNLNAVEQMELASFVTELEEAEASYLTGANERLRRDNDRAEKRHQQLDRLVQRKEALAQRLAQVMADAQAERQAIESELATVLATNDGLDGED